MQGLVNAGFLVSSSSCSVQAVAKQTTGEKYFAYRQFLPHVVKLRYTISHIYFFLLMNIKWRRHERYPTLTEQKPLKRTSKKSVDGL